MAKYSDLNIKYPMSKTDIKDFMEKNPIDFGSTKKDFSVRRAVDLDKYDDWVLIDSTRGVGINYALKKGHIVYVFTGRYGGNDLMMMNTTQFNFWRQQIENNRGQ